MRHLYTREGCVDCEVGRALMRSEGWEYVEHAVGDPLTDFAIEFIFGAVVTPVLVVPGDGIYALEEFGEQVVGESRRTWVRKMSLAAADYALAAAVA